MIIDTHCHFDMMPYPVQYISDVERRGDYVIGMTNLPSHFKMGVPYVRSFRHVRLALGFHPLLASDNIHEKNLFEKQIDETSYIGEIGLDFSSEGYATRDRQIMLLDWILSSLKGRKKIISVHSRKAEYEVLALLQKHSIQNVIFHWYTGPVTLVREILSCGYYFSINEAMTRSLNGRNIISAIPSNRLLTETDAPFNKRTEIYKTLSFCGISESEIYTNFNSLLKKIR